MDTDTPGELNDPTGTVAPREGVAEEDCRHVTSHRRSAPERLNSVVLSRHGDGVPFSGYTLRTSLSAGRARLENHVEPSWWEK